MAALAAVVVTVVVTAVVVAVVVAAVIVAIVVVAVVVVVVMIGGDSVVAEVATVVVATVVVTAEVIEVEVASGAEVAHQLGKSLSIKRICAHLHVDLPREQHETFTDIYSLPGFLQQASLPTSMLGLTTILKLKS